MATVEYIGVSKSFGNVEVMRDLNLFKEDGAFTVLLGPSGCGKTTLLRMTAGLESVSAGDIMIGGRRVNDVHPRDRNIAMVFQNYALYPTMRVFDNIAFSLQVKRLRPEEVRRRVEEAAATLNISEYLDRYPKELSGGQRQRVAMGRAMVRDAEVFLFDEPLSNLDAKLRSHMRVEIRLLHQRLGATTIYVTHDQIEAMTMADKIVLMRAGDIEQIGTPEEVYDRPASKFAADFIGSPSMNFMSGEIEADPDGGMAFNATGVRIPVRTGSLQPGQRVICGIRPNDVEISAEGSINATLQLAETTGADVQLHTQVGPMEFVALAPRGLRFASGDSMRFAVDPAKLHLFDATNEQRIA